MSTLDLGRAVARWALSRRLSPAPGSCAVLTYHDVSLPSAPQHAAEYSTTPDAFVAQVDFVGRYFQVVDLADLVEGPTSRHPRVAITFDDGFRSVMQHARPVLVARGMSYTVFVNRDAAEHNRLEYGPGYERLSRAYGTRVYLDAEEIRQLADEAVLIGNHTRSHPDLSTCDAARLEDEIVGNQEWLEEVTARPVRHLALPFGKRRHLNDDVLRIARASGHAFIYGTDSAFWTRSDTLIPRFSVLSQDAAALTYMFNRAGMRRTSQA